MRWSVIALAAVASAPAGGEQSLLSPFKGGKEPFENYRCIKYGYVAGFFAGCEEQMGNVAVDDAGNYTCEARIAWLMTYEGGSLSEAGAKERVGREFREDCGACAPDAPRPGACGFLYEPDTLVFGWHEALYDTIQDAEQKALYWKTILEQFAGAKCLETAMTLICDSFFGQCSTIQAGPQTIGLKQSVCQDVCLHMLDDCKNEVEVLKSQGLEDYLPDCGEIYGQAVFPKDIFVPYPSSLTGQPQYPIETVIHTLQIGLNNYTRDEQKAGGWGGYCVCPDGTWYGVGDENNACGSLACYGGESFNCNHWSQPEWSHKSVTCGEKKNREYIVADESVGSHWGYCECPDGSMYVVGDQMDSCGSLACEGGAVSACYSYGHPLNPKGSRVSCGDAVSSDFSSSTEVHLNCIDMEQLESQKQRANNATKNCRAPLKNYEPLNQCFMPCPHSLYSVSEYNALYDSVVAPSISMGILTFIVIGRDAKKLLRRKSLNNRDIAPRYQKFIALLAIAFYFVGPVITLVANRKDRFDMVCNLPVILYSTFTNVPSGQAGGSAGWSSGSKSMACQVNKLAIFFNMAGLNLLAVHLLRILQRLRSVLDPKRNKYSSRIVVGLEATAVLVPTALAILAYCKEGLERNNPEFEGHFARWTIACGFELTLSLEVALIHGPFLFTGFLLMMLFAAIRIVLRQLVAREKVARLSLNMVSPSAPNSDSPSFVEAKLVELAKKITTIALALSIVLGFHIGLTISVIPQISSVSNQVIDTLICESMLKTGSSYLVPDEGVLRTVTRCEELGHYWNNGIYVIPNRPSVFQLSFLLNFPALVPFVLVGTYAFILRSREQHKATRVRVKPILKEESFSNTQTDN